MSEDFLEPWSVEDRVIVGRDKRSVCDTLPANIPGRYRAVACVNACAGMEDPAKEIERLRRISVVASRAPGMCYCESLRDDYDECWFCRLEAAVHDV